MDRAHRFSGIAGGVLALAVAAAGCPGPPGPKGDPGGLTGYERIQRNFDVPAGFEPWDGQFVVECSSGKKVLGGGYHRPQAYDEFEVWTSQPSTESKWVVEVWNKSANSNPLVVIAICADVAS